MKLENKKALWLTVDGAVPTRGPTSFRKVSDQHDAQATGVTGGRRFKFKTRRDLLKMRDKFGRPVFEEVRPRKRIAPMSKKRTAESRQYRASSWVFLAEHPLCQRPGCGKSSECVHHWAGRRSNYLKVETWRASCIACNDFAKQNPKAARAENWIAPVGVYLT